MDHHHDHSHGTINAENTGKVFWISIGLNVLYVVAEVVAGFIYDSMALLTDAGHNVSDIASLLLSLFAFRLSKKKPDKKFTYGYKKSTVLAALANAVILLIAIGVLGYETFMRFKEPRQVEGNAIAWVAGLGIVINGISAFLFFKNRESDLNIKSAYLHLLADALVSVGVVVTGIVISFTGWYILDPLIGFVVLIVILVSTWSLFTDSLRLAVDAVPEGIDLDSVKKKIAEVPGVKGVDHLHIWAISTTENSLTVHVQVNEAFDFEKKMEVIKEIKHRLAHENIPHSTIELDSAENISKKNSCSTTSAGGET